MSLADNHHPQNISLNTVGVIFLVTGRGNAVKIGQLFKAFRFWCLMASWYPFLQLEFFRNQYIPLAVFFRTEVISAIRTRVSSDSDMEELESGRNGNYSI